MLLGKMSFKAAALALVSAVMSMAAQSSISPMTFEVGGQQQEVENWNYLRNFKLWGTNGIEFGNRPEFFDQRFYNKETNEKKYSGVDVLSLGWVGSAKGDLTSSGVSGWLDGPIIVGGAIRTDAGMTLLTGPVRTSNGSISCSHSGTTCQGANQSGVCSYDKVPQIRSDLSVPNVDKNLAREPVLEVSGKKVIDVDSECSGSGMCDIFYSSINFQNDSRLVVKMPEGGRVTRIFTNKLDLSGTHPEIVVNYGKGDLNLEDYEGNLLIYVNDDIVFKNTDNSPIMGTFVSKGKIEIICNMKFAGQMIANKVYAINEIKADNFVFKPFVPIPELAFLNNEATKIKESNTWTTLNVALSEPTVEDVSFEYCFEFHSVGGVTGVYAGHADVGEADASHAFPICGSKTDKVTIPAGETQTKAINIKPLIDGLVEGDEALWLQISKLEGAKLASSYEDGKGYKIFIISEDKLPTVSSELVFDVNEDTPHAFTSSEFKFQHASQTFASVIITGLPAKGTLAYNGSAITASGKTIAVADLGKLTYQAEKDDFGNKYTTFKYKVVGSGSADNTSVEYMALVNVIPVNDKPEVSDATFRAQEIDRKVSGGPIKINDAANERNTDTYTYTLVNVTGSDYSAFNSTFEIVKNSDQSATIRVKSGAVLDYAIKKQYVVYATVTDDAATETKKVAGPQTSERFKITVNVENQNDDPVIKPQTFTMAEKQANGSDWPSGTTVGSVLASDPDGDALTYTVVDSGIPFDFKNSGSNQLVVKDGSALDYETKNKWVFEVSVSDGNGGLASTNITVILTDVNEPPKPNNLKSEYSVNENSAKGTVVGTFDVFDNDKVSGDFEILSYTLEGALTGAYNTTAKSMGEIFEVKQTAIDGTGNRTVSILVKDKALLDYEALYNGSNATYPVSISIFDSKDNKTTVTTKIAVKDVNETPWIEEGLFYIWEHSDPGTQVCVDKECSKYASVKAGDTDRYTDSFKKLTYEINTTSSKNTAQMIQDAKSFEIDGSGRIKAAKGSDFNYTKKIVYKFLVTVSDGSLTADAVITVNVVDVEEPPQISYAEGTATIKENSSKNTKVVGFNKDDLNLDDQAKFDALGSSVSFGLSKVSDEKFNNIFDVSSEKGVVTVKNKDLLDYEALYTGDVSSPGNEVDISIRIISTENAGNELVVVKHIAVTDENEPPEITKYGPYSVPETLKEEGSVGYVVAVDPDSCTKVSAHACRNGRHPSGFNKLHYFIDDKNTNDFPFDLEVFPFVINESTGEITLKKGEKLSYSNRNKYVFTVKVRDSSLDPLNPPNEVTKKVTINVEDVNEPSEFRFVSDLYEIDENVKVGTSLDGRNIIVYDEDIADRNKLKISITDNDASTEINAAKIFEVVQVGETDANHLSTFAIRTKANVDYEALYKKSEKGAVFNVTLTVTDQDSNKVSKNTKIRVNDVNEQPSFTEDSYSFKVRENIAKDSVLGKAKATDPDFYNPKFGTLYFSLEGEDAAPFDVDISTGDISVIKNAKLDYETKSSYEFKVIVTDRKFTKSVPVTVLVIDENETPKFPDYPPTFDVDENTKKGTLVGVIVAEDDDCKGIYKKTCKTPTYSLDATDDAADDYKAFTIDDDGSIKVIRDSVLNYEVQNEYHVRVVATDGDNPTLFSTVDIVIMVNDVNDAPIYAKKEYVFEIHENAPKDEFVGSVDAKDEDTWSKLTYTLSDYVIGSKDASVFRIDGAGKIYLNGSLNYETQKQYQVWATATDNGKDKGFENYSATTLVTINLIDDPDAPIIIDDGKKGYDVEENTADENTPTGTEIACYEVKDEDDGQTKNFVAYVTDAGDTDADRLFDAKIKRDTKSNKYNLCLIVKNGARLNYETIAHVHKVNVAVMDADKLTAQVTKTINIIDVNEMPIISGSTTFSFYENKGKDYVVGKLYSDDIDTSKVFTQNVFAPIGGDTTLFTITEDGKIKTKQDFDFETSKRHTFEMEVSLSDKDSKKYPKLTTKQTVTITLKDMPEIPQITSKEFEVKENSDETVVIGTIEAVDPDGEGVLIFELVEDSPYVTVSPEGEIKVREGAIIDYEQMPSFTITVMVTDIDGLYSESDIVINVIDVNEPPKIEPQEFTFPEDSKPGTKKGPVEAHDPDSKNKEFSDLKFYLVEKQEKFEIKTNGDIVLKGELDYESEKSYVIKVYVTDGEFSDTTDVLIKVGNVIEKSEVEITRVEAGDSVYVKPTSKNPIYTNKDVIFVEWTQDGKTKSSLDSLKEGKNVIIKKYKDSTKDIEGADTVIVFYSTAAPSVDLDATKIKVEAENIYTIVETVDKKDSSIYVNNKTKDVQVSIEDSVSKFKDSFTVSVVLDTIAVSNDVVKDMVKISKSDISLEKNPSTTVKSKPIDGKTKLSYTKVVNGDTLTVSYYVDDKGDVIKRAVIDENGKKTMKEVIEVSTVVEVKGKNVVVSYKADAETGAILYGDSEGNLMVNVPKGSSSSKPNSEDKDVVELKTGVGAFTVTYVASGKEGNKTMVSYVIDEKGKIVANEEGDRGYLVTYEFTNKYGNSAEKSVFMVFDKLAPVVKILSPSENDVVYANFVDVDWCIAVDGDEKNCVKQDTLNFQSLEKGVNTIKRIYRDKAGNETIAEVNVMMKKAKDVNINLEDPMVIVSIDSVNKYYEINPPEENQRYAVSILNAKTQKEKEIVKGNADGVKTGSGEEPYPGYDGHIGPTVKIDMRLPIVSAVGGLATLDDIIINGDMVALDGVDADGSRKMPVKEYVEEYCSAEFQEELGKDLSKATLYSTSARVTLWFFTTSGQFVDKYKFDYVVDDPDFVDKAGIVKFFFEMKPDMNGELKDKSGRLYGTGPYIVKTEVNIRSQLRCVVPPVDGNSKIGDVLKSSDEMTKRFGYRRPVLR